MDRCALPRSSDAYTDGLMAYMLTHAHSIEQIHAKFNTPTATVPHMLCFTSNHLNSPVGVSHSTLLLDQFALPPLSVRFIGRRGILCSAPTSTSEHSPLARNCGLSSKLPSYRAVALPRNSNSQPDSTPCPGVLQATAMPVGRE